jgi:uncharacterized protein (DUF697 family)
LLGLLCRVVISKLNLQRILELTRKHDVSEDVAGKPSSAPDDGFVKVDTAEARDSVPDERSRHAIAIVHQYMGWSSAAGLIPFPGADLVALVSAQVAMLRSIGRVYGQAIDGRMMRPLLLALVTSSGGYALAASALSAAKAVPFVGTEVGILTMPAIASASCYATGRAFIAHFESGGTLINLRFGRIKALYKSFFRGRTLEVQSEAELA